MKHTNCHDPKNCIVCSGKKAYEKVEEMYDDYPYYASEIYKKVEEYDQTH